MKTIRILSLFVLLVWLLAFPGEALAQDYLFSVEEMTVHVFWNEDGTASIGYEFVFKNAPGGHPIDFVDVGMPNASFSTSGISADVDGTPVGVSSSEYAGNGSGVAVLMGAKTIPPGGGGRVRIFVANVRDVLQPDSSGDDYASAVFGTTWFGSKYVQGATNMAVVFHLPPGVQPEEPRWHAAPSGWSSEPSTGIDDQGRITYTWRNTQASASRQQTFGASFPATYVPASAITRPSFLSTLGISGEDIFGWMCCGGFALIIALIVWGSAQGQKRRRMKYLPPKIAIEGHGIKRGLTSVEAAILMEQPMDKIMTMILFGTIKKDAATVVKQDPLEIDATKPLPEGLRPYEVEFLKAFGESDRRKRRRMLQNMMVDLVKSVSKKMKGFSRRETVAYYKGIVQRAWSQVEAADTPEVKSEKYDQVMEWTMLDKDYEDRTQDVFRGGPVYVPMWWPRYDPGYRGSVTTSAGGRPSVPTPSGGRGGVSLPTLPGATFAAGMVNSVQNFSSSVVGNLNSFTSAITNKTNPVPKSTSSSWSSGGGGGGGCACACACAGCACACAGGGR